jgi:hypothetical protein
LYDAEHFFNPNPINRYSLGTKNKTLTYKRRIKRKVAETDFDRALEKALQLSKSVDANYLPGWCGPIPEE